MDEGLGTGDVVGAPDGEAADVSDGPGLGAEDAAASGTAVVAGLAVPGSAPEPAEEPGDATVAAEATPGPDDHAIAAAAPAVKAPRTIRPVWLAPCA